jgi:hypothetical protein
VSRQQCQHKLPRGAGRCVNDAVFGLYSAVEGQRAMRLVAVFCGEHKPKLRLEQRMRVAKLPK